jgi:hypothetical protein
MSTDFLPLTPIRMADLFSGRLNDIDVHEELCEGTTPDERCLTDGRNFVWVSCSGRELVTSFTSRGDPEHILQAISEEFGVRIVCEDEYWQHEPTEARYAERKIFMEALDVSAFAPDIGRTRWRLLGRQPSVSGTV